MVKLKVKVQKERGGGEREYFWYLAIVDDILASMGQTSLLCPDNEIFVGHIYKQLAGHLIDNDPEGCLNNMFRSAMYPIRLTASKCHLLFFPKAEGLI